MYNVFVWFAFLWFILLSALIENWKRKLKIRNFHMGFGCSSTYFFKILSKLLKGIYLVFISGMNRVFGYQDSFSNGLLVFENFNRLYSGICEPEPPAAGGMGLMTSVSCPPSRCKIMAAPLVLYTFSYLQKASSG